MNDNSFNYSDQVGLFSPNNVPTVHIIGAGGATNAALVCLATMGVFDIHVYDPDILERHNGAGEPMYSYSDIGRLKVDAAVNTVRFLRGGNDEVQIVPHCEFVDERYSFDGIVISGVDSMESRRKIWAAIKNEESLVPLYVDLRSAGTSLTVLIVDPYNERDVAIYESTWMYDDKEAIQEECGARNIPVIAFDAARLVGHIIMCYANGSLRKSYYRSDEGIDLSSYYVEQEPFFATPSK